MSRRQMILVITAAVVGLASGAIAMWLHGAHDRERLAHVRDARRLMCIQQREQIRGILNSKYSPEEIRDLLSYRITEESISLLCLGVELPVIFSDAEWCWIMQGGKGDPLRCYREPLRKLLALYTPDVLY